MEQPQLGELECIPHFRLPPGLSKLWRCFLFADPGAYFLKLDDAEGYCCCCRLMSMLMIPSVLVEQPFALSTRNAAPWGSSLGGRILERACCRLNLSLSMMYGIHYFWMTTFDVNVMSWTVMTNAKFE